ncbi:MAG: hypothetical protein BGO07_02945 [Alphaproteobacteria bacterium 40-19]|nr:MAG: hypothetical protein BGO07_02945 [Alphaproteobacteria bacterium 40-19]
MKILYLFVFLTLPILGTKESTVNKICFQDRNDTSLSSHIQQILKNKKHYEKVRILEIGVGKGNLVTEIFQMLTPQEINPMLYTGVDLLVPNAPQVQALVSQYRFTLEIRSRTSFRTLRFIFKPLRTYCYA